MFSSIDKYTRGLLSPCNRCKKIKSFVKHCCDEYPKRDNIPPEIFSGRVTECPHFKPIPMEDIREYETQIKKYLDD